MSLELTSRPLQKIEILKDRAALLEASRIFFKKRNVLEVDVPILSRAASVDLHIDLIEATCLREKVFLHSSPEYGMKRLLAEGLGDIFQISHVFRDYERGKKHTAEFMMVEWYRIGFTYLQMIQETVEYCSLFLPQVTYDESITYKDLFLKYIGFFPTKLEERDELYSFEIEPFLGQRGFTVITHYPKEQAALASIDEQGRAERFEVYYKGIELANGYHELGDPQEQELRFLEANEGRKKIGKNALPLDRDFIDALKQGLPDCCGVAVGFDRLMLIRHALEDIRDGSSFFI